MSDHWIIVSALVLICVYGAPSPCFSQAEEWCLTEEMFEQSHVAKGLPYESCMIGRCDTPYVRDSCIPATLPPPHTTTLRLYFHILTDDDGNDSAVSISYVDSQVDELNTDYADIGIQFEYEVGVIRSSRFRYMADNPGFCDLDPYEQVDSALIMKDAYCVGPGTRINVYIGSWCASFAVLPWDDYQPAPYALGRMGGVVMAIHGFYPNALHLLTHEIGHCLGLWHTFHGTNVAQCSRCWEYANADSCDWRGDQCCDTEPERLANSVNCSHSSSIDYCTDPDSYFPTFQQTNHMDYIDDYCRQEFTPQQTGRAYCWLNTELDTWKKYRIVRVPDEQPNIQAAISAAFDGDTIVVGGTSDTLSGEGFTDLNFNGKNIVVRPQGPAGSKIIDCESSLRAFTFDHAESDAKLIGFKFINCYSADAGGAIRISTSSPHIDSCSFENCHSGSWDGGAVYMSSQLSPVSPKITNCEFNDNSALDKGGAVFVGENVAVEIEGCTFVGNSTDGAGGALYVADFLTTSVTVTSCVFDNNTSYDAGAIYTKGQMNVAGNTFVNNGCSSPTLPAIVKIEGAQADVDFTRNIFAFNDKAAIHCVDGLGTVTFSCNDYWQNAGENGSPYDPSGLDVDPLFCDFANGEYTLQWGSPCADAYNGAGCDASIGAFDVDCGKPVLMSPTDGDTTADSSPSLDWDDIVVSGGTTTYEVQVDADVGFNPPERSDSGLLSSDWTVAPDLVDGQYYWRVRWDCELAGSEAIVGDWSDPWSFTVWCPVSLTGDVDASGEITAADIIHLVNYVYKGGPDPQPCVAAGDVDTSLAIVASDIIYLVNYVYKAGPAPCDVCPLIARGDWECTVPTAKVSAPLAYGDLGERDSLRVSDLAVDGSNHVSELHVINDEELVALDIPLRFGKAGDPIDLVRVEFTARVASWEVKHAQIDNQAKTVLLGLVSSLTGDWDNANLAVSTEASTQLASLVFKVEGTFTPSITTFTTERPGRALSFIYNRQENGRPYVEEFTPAFSSNVSHKGASQALRYELSENYPNPFNPNTSFTLTVPDAVDYSVKIYNIAGQIVRTIDGHVGAGTHRIVWDGRNNQGRPAASGVYFCSVRAGTLNELRRMLLLK